MPDVYVTGHRNPDLDSIGSAIGYAELKGRMDRETLAALRTALDQGELGAEGFMTSLRLGGKAVDEVKKVIFAPAPSDD